MKLTERIRFYAIAGQSVTMDAETAIKLCNLADQAQRDWPQMEAEEKSFRRVRLGLILVLVANVLHLAWRMFS